MIKIEIEINEEGGRADQLSLNLRMVPVNVLDTTEGERAWAELVHDATEQAINGLYAIEHSDPDADATGLN
tara:strand:+ start:114 stop:326 length:213 start_codon:yes stop_codon:yes gene_type:complete